MLNSLPYLTSCVHTEFILRRESEWDLTDNIDLKTIGVTELLVFGHARVVPLVSLLNVFDCKKPVKGRRLPAR